ncbi:NAD(P)/FAD-dependent oxidoreductase [Deinococcus sp. Marseille-Q6407]|uniref:NAD(P)/FAD-dependent oxidoreductase n=1 Tax=Deinococcus sp. Marseille-Q6407 TaxID=2969223 RepID=UPI0021C144BA|nr:FAD-binding oxidoreductase [Deinococcus sp. Marseille-Q6407]
MPKSPVKRLDEDRSGFTLHTGRGIQVQAGWVIVATGYEAEQFLVRRLAQLKNSYALVTEPLPEDAPLWPDGCLIWETARPYLYARTTRERRIIIGGEDDDFYSPARRERRLKAKAERLHRKLRRLQPQLDTEIGYSWAGTFGETKDGLAYIGPKPGQERLLFALGYGGNGITYSVQAARLLTAQILGPSAQDRADLDIFRLNR